MLTGRKIIDMLHGLKVVILMIIVQIMLASVNVLYKLAAADQFSLSVIVAYRFIFSAAVIVPVALYAERNKRPKLTWMILFQAFLCGLFGGALSQNLFAKCLVFTSATFAAASTNLIPSMTFIMALIFGLEKLGWTTAGGKAKLLGTLMCLGGAMLFTFYKGPPINIWKSHLHLLTLVKHHHSQNVAVAAKHSTNMVLGAILGLAFVLCYALWLIIQAKMTEKYPCPYSATALMSIMGGLQSTVYALCTERDWSQWKLGWNIRLLTVAYLGILAHAMTFTFIAWVVQMKGPLFVSSFNPLTLVLVAIAGSLLLEEQLHLGSVIGGVIIVCGLYLVIWGKSKEAKKMLQLVPEGVGVPISEKDDASESKRVDIDISTSLALNSSSRSTATADHSNNNSICEDEAVGRDVCVNIAEDELIRRRPDNS